MTKRDLPATRTMETPAEFIGKGMDEELFRDWLGSFARTTTRAYGRDIELFAKFLGTQNPMEAMAVLVSHGQGYANACAMRWRKSMEDSGLAPNTVNRRLSALRSIIDLGNELGKISWTLSVKGIKTRSYRDTTGPTTEGVISMWRLLQAQGGDAGARNRAIFRLLWDLGLRRGEISGLDLTDVDLERGLLNIMAKGWREKQALSLPGQTKGALKTWIETRGDEPGPLFVSLDRAHRGTRLSTDGIYKFIRKLASDAGIKMVVSPHRVRHSSITHRLELSGGDLRMVQRFSRHAKIETMMIYDDRRQDQAGEIAADGAALLE